MTLTMLTIGQISRQAGVTPRAIRHYERLGLIAAPMRTDTNYRLFDRDSLERVKFIAKCRSLGFSIPEIADLSRIMEDRIKICAQVAELTQQHLELVDGKIRDLVKMRRALGSKLSRCSGQDDPECAVLEFLNKPA